MDTLNKSEQARKSQSLENSTQVLTISILDTNRLAFKYQDTKEQIPAIRKKQEQYLFETYQVDYGRSLLVLGLLDSSVNSLSALDFWRTFCGHFVHAVLLDP